MQHVAVMKKSWGLIPKILSGEKTIESRWYLARRAPWGKIAPDETVFFKNAGEPVIAQALVDKVMTFSDLTPAGVKFLLEKYGKEDGIEKENLSKYYKLFKDKRYCILVFLKEAKPVSPFNIDKKGFGAMCAWLTAERFTAKNPWTSSFEW